MNISKLLLSAVIGLAWVSASAAPLWSGGVFVIQSRDDNANNAFALYFVKQEGLHVTGKCLFIQASGKTPATAVIPATDTRDGGLWPDVTAQVSNERNGEWKTIAKPFNYGHRATIEVGPGEENRELLVTLDIFIPLIGQYKLGRLVLTNGDATVFDLKELVEDESTSATAP